MNYFVYAIIALLFCAGLYRFLCTLIGLPSIESVRIIDCLNGKGRGFKEAIMYPTAKLISKFIHLSEIKKNHLQMDIKSMGLTYTPELFIALPMVIPFYLLITSLLILYFSRLASIIIIMIGIRIYYKNRKKNMLKIQHHRTGVIIEAPQLAGYVQNSLKHREDVYNILRSYRDIAGQDMKRELDVLLVDMHNGNRETALIKFESRFDSDIITMLTRGLISLERGENMQGYFEGAVEHMKYWTYAEMELEAKKRPGELTFCNILLIVGMMCIAFAAIFTQAYNGIISFN